MPQDWSLYYTINQKVNHSLVIFYLFMNFTYIICSSLTMTLLASILLKCKFKKKLFDSWSRGI